MMISPFFSPNVGGVETHLDDLCQFLARRGHDVQVVCYQPLNTHVSGLGFESSKGVTVRRLSWFRGGIFYKLENNPLGELAYLAPLLFWFSALSLLGTRDRPDVIHSHGITATAVAVALGKIFRIRTVSSLHTIYRLDKRRQIFSKSVALLLSMSDKVLVPSPRAKQDLQAVGLSGKAVDVYTYWVNQHRFQPRDKQECRRLLGLRPNGPVVLFIGRLIESKGVLLLISVAKRMPDYTFLFVGEGPLHHILEGTAKACPNIVFVGRKDNRELPQVYNCADLLWGSADEDYVGRVSIEALSCGIPVIIPDRLDIFGIERKVSSELLGLSVCVRVKPSPEEIEARLRSLRDNGSVIETMSMRSREVALLSYSEANAHVIEMSYLSKSDEPSQG